MAARENQGYLIAVIVLVLISLALALVAFLGVQSSYEQAETATASEAKLKVSRLIAQAETLKGEALKAMIGDLGPAPTELEKIISDLGQISTNKALSEGDKKIVADIVAEVRTAQQMYQGDTGGSISDEGGEDAALATLRNRITELSSLVDNMRNRITVQRNVADDAASTAKEKIKQAQANLASANKVTEEVKEALRIQAADALKKIDTLTEQVKASKATIDEVTLKSDEAAQQASALLREAQSQITSLEQDKANLKITLNQFTNQSFDNPDGQVIRVASALDTVFIDIGSADGLTNNRTFSVYDQSVTNFETATPKGSIEVVRVQTFRSEARVTNENPVDPILRGDFILTPTWDPGFSLKIALAGRFDLDGDSYDDTEKLIRLIERNGGEVVVRHDEKGNVTGTISPEVRYLVKGNEPLIGDDDGDVNAGKIINALRDLEADAKKNTVQKIDLQKLLNRMGVPAQPKTKQLDFPPGGFVPRQPGSIQGSSSTSR